MLSAATILQAERSMTAPIRVSDAQLDYWGDRYLAEPECVRGRHSFERWLSIQVRNQALFIKVQRPQHSKRYRLTAFLGGDEA